MWWQMAGRGRDAHEPPDTLFATIINGSSEINKRLIFECYKKNIHIHYINKLTFDYLELLIHSAFLESHVRAHLCNDW